MSSSRKRPDKPRKAQLSAADLSRQLADTAKVEALLERIPVVETPPEAAGRDTFLLDLADGVSVTGCSAGNERLLAQFLFSGIYPILVETSDKLHGSTVWTLEATRAVLLSAQPKSPLESMLVFQMLATHQLAMTFCRRALRASDSDVSSKFAARYVQLAGVAAAQAECIQKLRGEAGKQHVVVQHLTVEEGGKALVGQVNTPGGLAPK